MKFFIVMYSLLLSSAALAGDCSVELKSTDDYRVLSSKLKCLNDRINALEGSNPMQKVVAKPKANAGTQVQEAGGLRIELEGCAKAGGNISCNIFVTSTANDQRASFYSSSHAVDSNGTVVKWKGYQTSGAKMETGDANRYFIADVRNAATMFFEAGDAPVAEMLSALQIKFNAQSSGTLTFRNVALK
jgi:hypothetical protein